MAPAKRPSPAASGIDTFGVFLHLGGSNTIPFTYVDNCAEAIALAGLRREWMAKCSMSWTTICLPVGSSCASTKGM